MKNLDNTKARLALRVWLISCLAAEKSDINVEESKRHWHNISHLPCKSVTNHIRKSQECTETKETVSSFKGTVLGQMQPCYPMTTNMRSSCRSIKYKTTIIRQFAELCMKRQTHMAYTHQPLLGTRVLILCGINSTGSGHMSAVNSLKHVWHDLSFVTWYVFLLEAAIRRWEHCGHNGMDTVNNNTHPGCGL